MMKATRIADDDQGSTSITRGLLLPVLAGGFVLVVLLWSALVYQLDQNRQADLDQTRRDVTNLSVALAEQVSRLISGTDQVMKLMQSDFAQNPNTFDFDAWIKRLTSLQIMTTQIAIFDEHGDLVHSRSARKIGARKVNVADRRYFQYLSTQNDTGLFVAQTVLGRIDGKYAFLLARRLQTPDGRFAGVLSIALDPDYIAQQFRALDVGQEGSIALFGVDGYVRVRSPGTPGMYDVNITSIPSDNGLFANMRRAPVGTYEVMSAYDKKTRIYGYRSIDGLPLVVTVGKSRDEVLAPFGGEQRRMLVAGVIVTIVILAFLATLVREFAKRARREKLLVEAHYATREAEARFRGVFESSTDLLYVHRVAPDGSFVLEALNQAAVAATGLSPDVACGKPPEELLPPPAAARVRANVEQVIATSLPVRTTHDKSFGGAGDKACEIILVPLFGDDGTRVARVFTSVRDVTHLREAEIAIAKSEARYRLLADHSTDMISDVGLDYRRLFVSPASHALVGYAPEELTGTRPQDFVHPDDQPHFLVMIEALATGRAESGVSTHRLRHKAGRWIWVEGSWSLVRDAAGQPTGFVASVRNAEARQQAKESMRAAKESAERAQHAAEQASLAKSDFLATMSHEIRTPLNGVLGYTDLLLAEHGLGAAQRRHVECIQSAGAALRTVVDDILDFSKIEAGQIDLDPRSFKPRRLVEDALSIVRGASGARDLRVTAGVDDAVPANLIGDEDRLRQVLLNLLNNAVKFTPAGSVTLSVGCVESTGASVALRFAVTDTGIGIPDDKRSRLFERFSQVDSSIRRAFGGTGLGLAICKSLVKAMGGEIGVESIADEGSTFWFVVPLPVGEDAAEPQAAAVASKPARSALVLLAEDLEINQILARSVIEAAGHTVDIVCNGAEAVQAVRMKPYDLVLMDVQMPTMDGIAATRHIRDSEHPSRSIPIIAMTANILPAQVAQLLASGMDAHVGKPFKRDELLAAVDRWQAGRADVLDLAAMTNRKLRRAAP